MKKIFLLLLLFLFLCGCGASEQADAPMTTSQVSAMLDPVIAPPSAAEETLPKVEESAETVRSVTISFSFDRMPTMASNQLAAWVEDEHGALVKTLAVTSFTANRRGYEYREDALCTWVTHTDPASLSDVELDAISCATPSSGQHEFLWDLTDAYGERVPEGRYAIYLEGTLFWSSNVLYQAELDTALPGELTVSEARSEPDNPENETMLQHVRIWAE